MIPMNISVVLAESDSDNPEKEALPGPVEACIDKSTEISGFADVLDNKIIGSLEKLVALGYTVCTIMNTINRVMNSTILVHFLRLHCGNVA